MLELVITLVLGAFMLMGLYVAYLREELHSERQLSAYYGTTMESSVQARNRAEESCDSLRAERNEACETANNALRKYVEIAQRRHEERGKLEVLRAAIRPIRNEILARQQSILEALQD